MKYIILEQDTAIPVEDFLKIGSSVFSVKDEGYGEDKKYYESTKPVSMTVIDESVLIRLKK